jgi:hypothetical protein
MFTRLIRTKSRRSKNWKIMVVRKRIATNLPQRAKAEDRVTFRLVVNVETIE